MNLCHKCQKLTKAGCFNFRGVFVCKECEISSPVYMFDEFIIEDDQVKVIPPYSGLDEKNQRALVIDLVHRVFNQDVSKMLYSQLQKMVQRPGYSYLGIARAIEYHFVIQKQSIAKANGGIGIVPFVYEKAQTFYASESSSRLKKWKTYLTSSKNEQKSSEVIVHTESKKKDIDMSQL